MGMKISNPLIDSGRPCGIKNKNRQQGYCAAGYAIP